MKQDPCCARRESQLLFAKRELRSAIVVAERRQRRGVDLTSAREAIAKAKANIAMHEQNIVDHEAEHAG